MDLLLHIVSADDWDPDAEAYRHPSLESDGFIHCSEPDQVRRVAEANYAGETDLRLLCIDPAAVDAEVVYEALGAAEEPYPHVYGPIDVDAVIDVVPFPWTADGFELPERVVELAASDG